MAYLRKSALSPYWIACYRDAEGRQLNRSTKQTGKIQAFQVAFEFERLARNAAPTMAAIIKVGKDLLERLGQSHGDPTIEEEFLDYQALGDRSDSTKERYKQITDEFLAHLGKAKARKLSALTAGEVESFKLKEIKKGLAGKSINIKLKMIRSALARAERAGRIERNPAAQVDNAKEQAAGREDFTPPQITALLRACVGFKKEKGADWHGLVIMCYYTGCRLSDAANLRAGDVHLDGQPAPFIEYTERKKRNSPKVRKTLHADLADYLLTRSAGDDPQAFLFPKLAERGTGGAHGLSGEFVALMEAAGLERRVIRERSENGGRRIYNLSEHSLRHACVSQLQEAGVSEDLRMQIIGHEDKEVHRNYAHARNKAAAAVQSLPSVLPVKDPAPGDKKKKPRKAAGPVSGKKKTRKRA
jgi:integrase